jgi:hypothetical protein
MDQEGFLTFLHFIKYTPPSPDDPVLLILDGHNNHKSLEAIMEAKQAGIHLLSIPPHTSHKLQPLDNSYLH